MKFAVSAPHIILLLLSALEAPTLASARALAVPSDSRPLTQSGQFIPRAETKADPLVSRGVNGLIDKIKEGVDKTVDKLNGNGGGGGGGAPGQDTAGGNGGGDSAGQQDGRDSSRFRLRQVELNVTSTTTTTAGVPEATDGAAKPVLVIKPIEEEGGEEQPVAPEGVEVAV
ncbi:hypothetical protein QBC42DRAFT_343341 [Cladorrhinum samala]|uniref:Uncharacterized protein n=1 Tax=Cladorrhinum samala TaxID=585594 RepID=A0AAV9I2P5_9PEZI|nr:hypothetical protein QBC42DRAFT_343341 [Cladorrhinum samala]